MGTFVGQYCSVYGPTGDVAGYVSDIKATSATYAGQNSPRRKNWYLFKSEMRCFGGYGYTADQWRAKIAVQTSDPSTNAWDVYYSLYKGKYVAEAGFLQKVGSTIGSVIGVAGTAIGGAVGGPVGAAVGGGLGKAIGGALGGTPAQYMGTGTSTIGTIPTKIAPVARRTGCFIATEVYPGPVPLEFYGFRNKLPEWIVKSYYLISQFMIIPYIRIFRLHKPIRFALEKFKGYLKRHV